jgi:hypothetical protein
MIQPDQLRMLYTLCSSLFILVYMDAILAFCLPKENIVLPWLHLIALPVGPTTCDQIIHSCHTELHHISGEVRYIAGMYPVTST